MQGGRGGRGMDRYIRRKQLDPLETYVPVVLASQDQLLQAGEVMGGWQRLSTATPAQAG